MTNTATRAVVSIALATVLASGLSAQGLAQAPQLRGQAGDWKKVFASGLLIYLTDSEVGSHLSFACDVAKTEDGSATAISLELNGKLLPPDAEVTFVIDDETISLPSGKSGGVKVGQCATCAEKFGRLWRMTREGSRLTITGANGNRDTFSLRGTAELMPVQPCGED